VEVWPLILSGWCFSVDSIFQALETAGMHSPGIDRVTQLVAVFTLLLVAGLLSGGWIFHARMSEAFELAHRQALREQGAIVRTALKENMIGSASLEELASSAGLDRLELLDVLGRIIDSSSPELPPSVHLPEMEASLGLEFEAEPLRDGNELFLTLYLPLENDLGELEGYLLLEAGARLSDQLIRLRQGLWIATGAGVVFVSFVLLSMALILRQARRRQRELDRAEHLAAVGTLAAGLAHEIRNPLAIILGHAELLEMESQGKEANRAVEILEETERLRRLLNDFLHYARPMELQLADVDLLELWDRCIKEAQQSHPKMSFRLEAEGGPKEAYCDSDRLRQIALNLLANAVSFSPDGGEVLVSIGQDGRSIQTEIQDQGSGVQDEVREKLFAPFVSGREGGTGLGLALSRSLAQAHGGDLTLESSSSAGSKFRLSIPIKAKGQDS